MRNFSTRVSNPELISLLSDIDELASALPNMSFGSRAGQYAENNRFPDASLEGTRELYDKCSAVINKHSGLVGNSELTNYEELVAETAIRFLTYGLSPGFIPSNTEYYYLSFDVTPYNFPVPVMMSYLSAFPIDTPENAAKFTELMSDYPRFAEQYYEKLKAQALRGIYLSIHAVPTSAALLRNAAYDPKDFPASLHRENSAATPAQAALVDGYITEAKRSFERAADFLESAEYTANAPHDVGLWQYPNGREFYRYLRKYHLGYDIDAGELQELGKTLLSNAQAQQAEIRAKLGFSGTHEQFIESLRTNPRFFPSTSEELRVLLSNIIGKYRDALPNYFSNIPHTDCRVERLPAEMEAGMTFGYYNPPDDINNIGVYYYNASNLGEKCQIYDAALMAHELLPGHHFQMSLVRENELMPRLLKDTMCSCYTEGWAEYASLLMKEEGLYADLYDDYGRLEMDKFTCARLIADTGLNESGWDIETATNYLAENSFISESMARSEVLRYATDIPGQCLPYKYGSILFLKFREHYKNALGSNFNIKDFHSLTLNTGSVPMDILERYIERDIAQKGSVR